MEIAPRPIEVLLVEDNQGDIRLTMEAFNEHKFANQINVVTDGVQALAYLNKEGEYAEKPRPDLILLDLNLPKKDGREVLKEIKEHPDFRRIPVVVLTTSNAEQDVLSSYDLHANSYITKPVDFAKFIDVVKQIEDFWLSLVVLPPK